MGKSGKDTESTLETLFLYSYEIATLFKRAESTIRDWAVRSKARKVKDGNRAKYYLPDIFEFYEAEIASALRGHDDNLDKVRAELERVKLEKEKINLAVLKGEYVKKEQVEIEWAQRASELRQGLIALEYRLASQLANKRLSVSRVRELIRSEILSLLEAYTKEGEYTPQVGDITHEEFEERYFEFLRGLQKGKSNEKKTKPKRKRKKSAKST